MSRENANSGNRCSNCGGRMRLVNVTWVNRFPTSLAGLNGSSVSRYKKPPQSTAQEMMCTCCGQRTPVAGGKVTKAKASKAKTVKPEKVTSEVKDSKKRVKVKRKNIVRLIKFLIFLAAIAVTAYFAYCYKDTLIGYWESLEAIFGKVAELIARLRGI